MTSNINETENELNSSTQNMESIAAFDDNDEKIINWEEEAQAIINDVKSHVKHIETSSVLPSTETNIYINVTTFEDQQYCVHVSSAGFRIVSNSYDTIDEDKSEMPDGDDEEAAKDIYETPYALLDKISPSYVQSFGNQLTKQLLSLQQMQTEFKEEDEEGLEEEEESEK